MAQQKKEFKFIIEHMEPEISEWVQIEYENMVRAVGQGNLILTGLEKELAETAQLKGAELRTDSIEEWPVELQQRVVLLDPKASQVLSPADGDNFDYLLFGGILGDDPPRDRTGILRRMGFACRHLGPVQMTTDTAVIVANEIAAHGRMLQDISFIDNPEISLRKGEAIDLPFRFVASNDVRLGDASAKVDLVTPILAPGLKEHLKKQNDEPIFFEPEP